MSRKSAREVAMKLAFVYMMGGEGDYQMVLDLSGQEEIPAPEEAAFVEDLITGVRENESKLDTMIAQHAIGWAIDRMPKVDICLLRIALYEMLYRKDIPFSVSINEAVELAKRYSGEKSPAFINGILGTLAKQLDDTPGTP